MRKMLVLLSAVSAVSVAAFALNTAIEGVTAQTQPIKRTELQRVDIEEMQGREGVMFIADIPPGAITGRHFHPGPEYVYVLEGTTILEPDGQPAVTLRKGEATHQPTKHVHNVRNGSSSEPARVLVFLISEKGQPLATLVEPPAGAQ